MNDTRKPLRFANYKGRVEVDSTRPLGPTLAGEWMWPVGVAYDEAADRSRVGFSFMPPPSEDPS